MKAIMSGLLMILRGILWIFVMTLNIALNGVKIMLLLLGLVMRVFLVFVRVGTP